ncbi:MAG: type IV toxin-antitoxin system AbiEi family antitoxin [Pseudomonadota bacterium]
MGDLAGIGKKGRTRLSKVLESNPRIITAGTVAEVLSLSSIEASRILSRWCKNGWIYRIKRGVYIPVPMDSTSSNVILEEPFVIADSIYCPGYIGGFSAIKHWDLTEQIIETIYYFSTKQIKERKPIYGLTKFKVKTVKKNKIFGTKTVWYGSKKVKVSDPTKTIVDILDDPKLVGGMSVVFDVFNDYIETEYCDLKKLINYADRMNNKTIFKRLGFMIDAKFNNVPEDLVNLKDKISSGYSNFDPMVNGRHIVEKWKLKVSTSWRNEYDRKK